MLFVRFCCKLSCVCRFYGQELTLQDNENGNSQLEYTFFFPYLNMNLNVGLHRTKPKNAKVKNSHLIQVMCCLICTILFLCVVGVFSSLKFDPPYVCVCIYICIMTGIGSCFGDKREGCQEFSTLCNQLN